MIREMTWNNEINRDVAYTIGKAYGTKLLSIGKNKCIVGYDNRESSIELSLSLSLGILSTGVDVINLGLVTTPMAIYSKEVLKIPSYVMVTASHNPKDDNGFKFSFDESGNVKGDDIDKFYDLVISGNFKEGMGKFSRYNVEKDYLELFRRGINLGDKKLKVVIDLANGTTSCIARELFEQFDIDLTIINEESDSSFPNHHPDPCVAANQKQLQDKVLELHADLGIGFDGDGDRCGIVDNLGHIIPTDIYMAIMCKDIILNNEDKRILYDVKCSNALKDEIVKWGGVPICYRTGASYTMAKVIDDNILFGGEYSGHLYFRDKDADCASAIYAALRLLEILSKTSEKLSKIIKEFPKYYSTPEIKIPCSDNKKFMIVEEIKKYAKEHNYPFNDIDGVRITYTNGWALVRASNTGPNLTFRGEATTEEGVKILENIYLPMIQEKQKNIDTL